MWRTVSGIDWEHGAVLQRMLDRKISVTEFANILGVTRIYLSNIINGSVNSEGLQARINKYLAIPPDFRAAKTNS